MEVNPASHPDSNFTDEESVSLVKYILAKHRRVMANISSIDKWPNIDGRVEIQDEHYKLIGPLSVQVKTLASNHNLKFDCKVEFLAYCENTEPCLLLAVDHQTKKVYWLYLDVQSVREIDYRNNKTTKTIYFKKSQYFDEDTRGYVEEWAEIVEHNKQCFQNHDDLKIKNEQLERLLKNANRAAGSSNSNFATIHHFLDELNRKYETDFPTVKEFLYPQTWKVGMAYTRYEPDKLSYTLFPIPYHKNDVLIKEIDSDLFEKLMAEGLGFTDFPTANPVQERPAHYAKEIVKSELFQLIKLKGLSHSGHRILACEYIMAFIDKFREQMGLPEKDEYSLTEVYSGFYLHLPLWVQEAYELLLLKRPESIQVQIMRDGYFDPDILLRLRQEDREEILQSVSKRMGEGSRSIRIATRKLDIGTFIEFFDYLKQCSSPITRVYKKLDYSRVKGKGGWIWNAYAPEDAEYNLRLAFQNLHEAYRVVIAHNFPTLENELDLFRRADRILVQFTVRDEYQGVETAPGYSMYYVKDETPTNQKTVEVLDEERSKALDDLTRQQPAYRWGVGNDFRVVSRRDSTLDFIYEETPLLNLTYELLKDRLDKHFAK